MISISRHVIKAEEEISDSQSTAPGRDGVATVAATDHEVFGNSLSSNNSSNFGVSSARNSSQQQRFGISGLSGLSENPPGAEPSDFGLSTEEALIASLSPSSALAAGSGGGDLLDLWFRQEAMKNPYFRNVIETHHHHHHHHHHHESVEHHHPGGGMERVTDDDDSNLQISEEELRRSRRQRVTVPPTAADILGAAPPKPENSEDITPEAYQKMRRPRLAPPPNRRLLLEQRRKHRRRRTVRGGREGRRVMRSDFESVDDDDFPIGGSPPSHDEQDDVGSLKHTTQLYDFVSDDEFGLLGADSGNLLLSEVSEEDTEDLVDSGEFEETGDDDDEEGDEGSEEEMGESLERRHPSIHDSVEHSDDSSRAEEVRGAEDDGGEEEKEEEEEFAKQEVIPKIRFGTSILTEELRESGLGGNPENPFFLRHPSQRRYPSARHHHQSHLFFSGEDHNRILLLKVWTGNGQSPMIVQIQGPQSVENVIETILMQYEIDGREPDLLEDPDAYELRTLDDEDNGIPDMDMEALSRERDIHSFAVTAVVLCPVASYRPEEEGRESGGRQEAGGEEEEEESEEEEAEEDGVILDWNLRERSDGDRFFLRIHLVDSGDKLTVTGSKEKECLRDILWKLEKKKKGLHFPEQDFQFFPLHPRRGGAGTGGGGGGEEARDDGRMGTTGEEEESLPMDTKISQLRTDSLRLKKRSFLVGGHLRRPLIREGATGEDPSDYVFDRRRAEEMKWFEVVKTNNRGRRQRRMLGVDGRGLWNRKIGGGEARKGFRDLHELSSCELLRPIHENLFQVTYRDNQRNRFESRVYRAMNSKERAEIVAKISFLIQHRHAFMEE